MWLFSLTFDSGDDVDSVGVLSGVSASVGFVSGSAGFSVAVAVGVAVAVAVVSLSLSLSLSETVALALLELTLEATRPAFNSFAFDLRPASPKTRS